MEWKSLRGNTDVIWTPGALIPVYHLGGGRIVLIDSGTEEDPELLAELDRRGLRVRAILCTHLHPDHIANNEAILQRDGAEVFASPEELEDVEETFCLLRQTSVLLGIRCPEPNHPITPVGREGCVVDGVRFEAIPTPGHTRGHLAWVTPDGVCCLGDAMVSSDRLRVSRLPYFEDVERAVETMETLRQSGFPVYLTAHRGVTPAEELEALVEENVAKELELYDQLRAVITEPMEWEMAVTRFMERIGLRPKAVGSPLMRHTAQARLTALINAGEYRMEDGKILPG